MSSFLLLVSIIGLSFCITAACAAAHVVRHGKLFPEKGPLTRWINWILK